MKLQPGFSPRFLTLSSFAFKLVAVNVLCCAALANAQSSKTSIEVSAGLEQDSNLNIVELDQNSHQSDLAVLLGAKADGKWQANEKLTLSGGYSFTAKTYQKQSAYDLALHQFSGDASYALEFLTLGASYHYADANLDKKDFLTLQQSSFYAAKLIHDKVYLRAAINIQDKQFAGRRERNAKNTGFAGDAFIFFNEGKTFLTIGISNEDENAKLHELDYSANTLKAKVSHQYLLWEKQQKLQAGWRYMVHDYTGVNPDLKLERYDSAHVTELEWEVNFTPSIAAVTKVEYSQYNSNLSSANYSDTQTSVTLKARF